jgi:D-alanyl-lipoteichoic acid acyltransferase DltB (MBOAT superfamily)
MLFNSYEFIFAFLPITFFVYFYLNSKRLTQASKGFLVFASLFFYSWWNVAYLPLILGSMLFNYVLGNSLSNEQEHNRVSKKVLLSIGVVANVLLLGYFKYADFFIQNVNYLTNANIPTLNLALPLAISFFTFQQISYLVDSYKKETNEYDFLNYALFVTFFPQLIAGPIVHHKQMMPQFAKTNNKVKNYRNIALGLFIFSLGLFKKVVIADTFSIWVKKGFDLSETLNFFEAWITSLSYTFQLYFDFSGYTDMAIGAALLFNIKLPINFNSPYKALDIQDFWRRWHITLSTFLRDYIYIPLGGNRISSFRTYVNLMATFIIGGLWHGAGWTFVFWGFLHGMALVIHRLWKSFNLTMNKYLAWFVTFNFINFSWIFFRANQWDDAIKVLKGMVGLGSNSINQFYDKNDLWQIIAVFIIVLFTKNSIEHISIKYIDIKRVVFISLLLSISILSLGKVSEFLYFNF